MDSIEQIVKDTVDTVIELVPEQKARERILEPLALLLVKYWMERGAKE
jgi:hypothetical protein